MERVNCILKNQLYQSYVTQNEQAEKDRIFCKHDMGHFLNVARLAMILNREDEYGQKEELIYAAALLHDIGRWKQYEDGTPHEEASAYLAPEILKECGFDEAESDLVLSAIESHRNKEIRAAKTLNGLLYRADKLSRPCFACHVQDKCNWKAEKKNLTLIK